MLWGVAAGDCAAKSWIPESQEGGFCKDGVVGLAVWVAGPMSDAIGGSVEAGVIVVVTPT